MCLGNLGSEHIHVRSRHGAAPGGGHDPNIEREREREREMYTHNNEYATEELSRYRNKIVLLLLTHLFSHWLWVGYSGGEEPVPLQPSVQPRPMVVTISRVWKTPWNESAKLFVRWIT